MDKSRVCVTQASKLAKQRCAKKTNLLVYERKHDPCDVPQNVGYAVPPIAAIPAKKIRICTGAELKKMCPRKMCDCPPKKRGRGFFGRLFSLIGLGVKAAIAGGLVYMTYEAGLWGDSEQTEDLYIDMCETVVPLFCGNRKKKEQRLSEICKAEAEYMCKTPSPVDTEGHCKKAPSTDATVHAFKQCWNNSVIKVFDVVVNFPGYVSSGYQYIMQSKDDADKKCAKKPDSDDAAKK